MDTTTFPCCATLELHIPEVCIYWKGAGGGGVRGEMSFCAKASPTCLQVCDTKLNKLISLSLFQMKIIFTHVLHRKDCLSALISPAIYASAVILD